MILAASASGAARASMMRRLQRRELLGRPVQCHCAADARWHRCPNLATAVLLRRRGAPRRAVLSATTAQLAAVVAPAVHGQLSRDARAFFAGRPPTAEGITGFTPRENAAEERDFAAVLRGVPRADTVLELGSGVGRVTPLLAGRARRRVVCVEASHGLVAVAKGNGLTRCRGAGRVVPVTHVNATTSDFLARCARRRHRGAPPTVSALLVCCGIAAYTADATLVASLRRCDSGVIREDVSMHADTGHHIQGLDGAVVRCATHFEELIRAAGHRVRRRSAFGEIRTWVTVRAVRAGASV
jgi:hypothetical protein